MLDTSCGSQQRSQPFLIFCQEGEIQIHTAIGIEWFREPTNVIQQTSLLQQGQDEKEGRSTLRQEENTQKRQPWSWKENYNILVGEEAKPMSTKRVGSYFKGRWEVKEDKDRMMLACCDDHSWCRLDYMWDSLKPKLLGTSGRDHS